MKYDAVVFDMDGVLRIGEHPIKGANDIIEKLHNEGIKGMISTNECRYTTTELREDLLELGITIPDTWDIYTAATSVRDYLEEKLRKKPDKNISVGIIGERGLFETLNELSSYKNFKICDVPPKYETKLVLIIGTLNKIKITNLEKGLKWVKAGAKIITTCNDTTDPASKGDFNLGMPNHTMHLLKYNCNISRSYSLGKPHPIHIKKINSVFPGIPNSKILFVGDSMLTDIQLAEENGLSSCLVLSGNTNKDTIKNYIVEADHIINSIINLFTVMD